METPPGKDRMKMPEERTRRPSRPTEKKKSSVGWQLIAVQSISCVVVILIALIFRLIGGSAFSQLRQSFNQSIMSNSILATFAALLDGPGSSGEGSDGGGTAGSTTTGSGSSPSAAEGATTTGESSSTGGTTASPAAAGGSDLAVTERKAFYAPEGATFAPLTISRCAAKPLEAGKVTSYFGYRENPIQGGISFHQALDIAADAGSPIAAMYFGIIREIGENDSYGKYIKIDHGNGIEVLYAHCSEILVQKDAVIRAGETVAKVGSTGDSTGPHLHVEVRVNGVAYDPAYVVPMDEYA